MKTKHIPFEELIVFENDDYFFLNKPPFVSTLDDRHDSYNLLHAAKGYHPLAQACHRLDKDTSGVLAFAKSPEAYRHLSIQFEKRQVLKIYHAVVDGIHSFQQVLVDLPILKGENGLVRISKDGKKAQTYFTTIQIFRHHTLLECRPITGRMHQIRIHLSTLQASITGDEAYGGKVLYLSTIKRAFNLKKETEELPVMKRMALHAYSLTLNGLDGKPVSVIAPYPKDFAALIRQLSKSN